MYQNRLFILILVMFYCCAASAQQPFTAGNIVVYRVGDGSAALTDNAAPVYLDEYTPGGTLVQSVAMPATPNGIHHRLTAKGTEVEGLLTLSVNGQYLVVPGGNASVGTVPGGTAGIIGLVDFNAKINTSTAVTDYSSNPGAFLVGGAVSDDGNRLWFGKLSEIRYTTAGSTTSALVGTSGNFMTGFTIADGQLYVGLEASTTRIRKVGTGLPTSLQSLTTLPGIVLASARSPKQFVFADLDVSVPGADVLYIADRGNATEGGLRKFSLVNGTWVANGVIGGPADQYLGVTVSVSGNVATLYATRQGGNTGNVWGGQLVKITDNSGYNSTITAAPVVLASVATSNVMSYRGVALVPQGCQPVLKLAANNVTSSRADLSWQAPLAGGANFEYAITESSSAPASGTQVANTSVSITGLNNDVTYFAHVRTVCNVLSKSVWATTTFKTGCAAPAIPAITISVSATGAATIRWNNTFGAASYEYVISKNAVVPTSGMATNDTFFLSAVDAVSKYYVYVRSNCGSGAYSPWASQSFSTSCLQPAVSMVLSTGTAVVTWPKLNNALRYEYALTKGASKPLSGTYTTDTTYLINKINQGAGYYFHCRSICSTGILSGWTTVPFHLQGMEAYPNPVLGSFTLRLHGTTGNSPTVTITNTQGKLIQRMQINSGSVLVDAKSWQAGMYFIQYQDGVNKYLVKVIKMNEH